MHKENKGQIWGVIRLKQANLKREEASLTFQFFVYNSSIIE